LTNGWRLTGITRFATGLPVTLLETDDRSLTGTSGGGPIQLPFDTPNYAGGKLSFYDPRTVNADGKRLYFDPSGFSPETLGQLGTANRRFFHGPGINNWDIALAKDTRLTERMNLEFRAEFFNAFNHAQFNLIATNYADVSNFGTVGSARDPRIIQFGLKLMF
jgi:hypothetical protein